VTPAEREPADAGTVTVYGSAAGFAQQIVVGRHRLTGDEAASAGGTDTGPNPYDFLLAALGSCTSMTVAMYARLKGWPLEAVTVRLRHSRIHAADCEECETSEGLLDQIDRHVEFAGALSEEQRLRLLAIANRCPVHRTLTSKVHIQTRLTRREEEPALRGLGAIAVHSKE
jgi:putative redox protein